MAPGGDGVVTNEGLLFADSVRQIELPLRRALVAAYGVEVGVEAAADAWAWAWAHRDEWLGMSNRAGYLFRVGQSAARRHRRKPIVLPSAPDVTDDVVVSPELPDALAKLTARQRGAVLLVHGHGYSLVEAAELLGVSVSTLRNHLDRGLRRLRRSLREPTDV